MLLALLIALAGLPFAPNHASAQPEEPTIRRPPIERCIDFCSALYGSESADLAQCAAACSDADVCSRTCNQRFADDKGKQTACIKRCMHSKPT